MLLVLIAQVSLNDALQVVPEAIVACGVVRFKVCT